MCGPLHLPDQPHPLAHNTHLLTISVLGYPSLILSFFILCGEVTSINGSSERRRCAQKDTPSSVAGFGSVFLSERAGQQRLDNDVSEP